MNAIELNQKMLDFAGRVHGNCMDHCLDADQAEYDIHNSIRELMVRECNAMARTAQRFMAHVNRFNTHNMPPRVRVMRMREARMAAQK